MIQMFMNTIFMTIIIIVISIIYLIVIFETMNRRQISFILCGLSLFIMTIFWYIGFYTGKEYIKHKIINNIDIIIEQKVKQIKDNNKI